MIIATTHLFHYKFEPSISTEQINAIIAHKTYHVYQLYIN